MGIDNPGGHFHTLGGGDRRGGASANRRLDGTSAVVSPAFRYKPVRLMAGGLIRDIKVVG